MRVPLGSFYTVDSNRDMLGNGTSMVRRGDGSFHKSRELVEAGVRVRCARREAAVFGRSRAKGHSYTNFPHDRMLGASDTNAKKYTNAGAVRCLPVHGCRVVEGFAILR